MLLANFTNVKDVKAFEVLSNFDCHVTSLERMKFILSNFFHSPITGRGNGQGESWALARDEKQRNGAFEKAAYEMSRTICLSPTQSLLTLDDDLYGMRSRDNQMKMLSARKADKEGYITETVCDALFPLKLRVRFRRRGESQFSNVEKIFYSMTEDQGKMSLHGLIVTVDRGYG